MRKGQLAANSLHGRGLKRLIKKVCDYILLLSLLVDR